MPDHTSTLPPVIGLIRKHDLTGHKQRVGRIAWSPDGSHIAASSTAEVIVWNIGTGEEVLRAPFGESGTIWDVAWSPDSWLLAVAHRRRVLIITGDGEEVAHLDGHVGRVYSVAWSPDGRFLASASSDHTTRIWDVRSRECVQVLTMHRRSVYAVAWSPQGDQLASSSKDGSVCLWDASSWEMRAHLLGHSGWVVSLAWSPDGARLASASLDYTIRIWNPSTARSVAVLEGHTGGVHWVSVSAGTGLLASGASDDQVRLWDLHDGRSLGVLDQPEADYGYYWPAGPVFAPSGTELAGLHGNDRTVRVWSVDAVAVRGLSGLAAVVYSTANVVLVGPSGAGKSGLAHVLTGAEFTVTASTQSRSVRMLPVLPHAGVFREVLLWELPGQEAYRLLNEPMLARADVAVIVADPRSDLADDVRHWVRAVRQAQGRRPGGGAAPPVLLVHSRLDVAVPGSELRTLQLAQELNLTAMLNTSAKTGHGVAKLQELILGAIDWDALPLTASSEPLMRIRGFLLAMKESGRQLTRLDELVVAFRRSGGNGSRADFNTALRLLESAGLVRVLSVTDQVLLQPELLETYAAHILAAARDQPDGLGTVSIADARAGDSPQAVEFFEGGRELEGAILSGAVEELLRGEMVLREGAGESAYLLCPSEVRRERPDAAGPLRGTVTYRFTGLALRVYATLVVRMELATVLRRTALWRGVVEYVAPSGGRCAVQLRQTQEYQGELILSFEGTTPEDRALLDAFVRGHLERYADGAERTRSVLCPTCGTEIAAAQVAARLVRGFASITCPVCDTRIALAEHEEATSALASVEVDRRAELRRSILEAEAVVRGKRAARDFDVYFSHHSRDLQRVREIAAELGRFGILPWLLDDQMRPGDDWALAMTEQASRARVAAIFYGPHGIGATQAGEVEMLNAEAAGRGMRIIPVLLPGVLDPSELPASLRTRAWVDFRRPEPDPLELLAQGIRSVPGSVPAAEAPPPDESPRRERQLVEALEAAERQGDYAACLQYRTELSQLLRDTGRRDDAVYQAIRALYIADDPERLNGKGMRAPLELLVALSPQSLEERLVTLSHRDLALRELREVAGEQPAVPMVLRRAGIERWLEWFANPSAAAITELPRGGQGWPAVRMRRLRLRNIKTCQDVACDFLQPDGTVRPVSAFVGDNATGKSTLLQAIALACLGVSFSNRIEATGAPAFLRNGEASGSIELELELTVDSGATEEERGIIHLGLSVESTLKDFFPLPDGGMTLGPANHMAAWEMLRGQVGFQWGYCAGYGAFRALRERRESLGAATQVPEEVDRVLSLFQPQGTLLEPAVLEGIFQADVSALSHSPTYIPLLVRDSVVRLFRDIIPDTEVREVDGRMHLVEIHSGVSAPAALSDGCNSMIALLGHVLRHTLELRGWTGDPTQAEGIVLIDEVDLHLHPSWQRRALQQLERAFPRLQFIVTTHSPLVLGGVPDGIVSVLGRDEEGRTIVRTGESVKGWRVDQLLTGMHFGVSSPYDVETERLSEEYGRKLSELGPDNGYVRELERRLDEQKHAMHENAAPGRDTWNLLEEFAVFRFNQLSPEAREQAVARMWEQLRK